MEIWLATGLSDGELMRTVWHELRHAADAIALGRDAYEGIARGARETTAEQFEAACWASFCFDRGQAALIDHPDLLAL